MNRKNFISTLLIFLAFGGCSEYATNSSKMDCTSKIVIDKLLFKNAPNDDFHFIDVQINKNCLNITVGYGGGCGEIEFQLIDSEFILKSNPLQRNLRLSFRDDDYCEAYLTKKLSFDLTPIQLIGENKIILNITNWDKSILYKY